MSRHILIPHVIDDCHKEIYWFANTGKNWAYCGIHYSNRDDANDVWGDEWSEYHAEQENAELNAYAAEHGYSDIRDMTSDPAVAYDPYRMGEINAIHEKYNPVKLTTIHGERRYGGVGFGSYHAKDKPKPKISKEEIMKEIIEQVSEFELIL